LHDSTIYFHFFGFSQIHLVVGGVLTGKEAGRNRFKIGDGFAN